MEILVLSNYSVFLKSAVFLIIAPGFSLALAISFQLVYNIESYLKYSSFPPSRYHSYNCEVAKISVYNTSQITAEKSSFDHIEAIIRPRISGFDLLRTMTDLHMSRIKLAISHHYNVYRSAIDPEQ